LAVSIVGAARRRPAWPRRTGRGCIGAPGPSRRQPP
jgi:hypothetical protein